MSLIDDVTLVEIPLSDAARTNLRQLMTDYPSIYGETEGEVAGYLLQRSFDDLARQGMLVPMTAIDVGPVELDDAAFGEAIGKAIRNRREAAVP